MSDSNVGNNVKEFVNKFSMDKDYSDLLVENHRAYLVTTFECGMDGVFTDFIDYIVDGKLKLKDGTISELTEVPLIVKYPVIEFLLSELESLAVNEEYEDEQISYALGFYNIPIEHKAKFDTLKSDLCTVIDRLNRINYIKD